MATYCICKKPDAEGVLWISCDKCKGWYHPSCVGLDEEEIDPDGDWFCPLCIRAGLVPAPIPAAVPLREARRCGRTKCGKFVEGNDLLCIDCKLIVIERNSNKLKRMRMEEDKSLRELNNIDDDLPSSNRSPSLHKPRQSKENNTTTTSNNRMERSSSKFKVQALMPKKKLNTKDTKSITRKQPQTVVHTPVSPKIPISPRAPASIDIDTLLSVPTTHSTPNSPRKISIEVHKTPKEEANTSTTSIGASTSPALSPPISPNFVPLKKRSFDISRSESASSSNMPSCVPLKKRIRSFDITPEPSKPQESIPYTSSYSFTSPAPSSSDSTMSHLERLESLSTSKTSNEEMGQIKSGRHSPSPVATVNNLSSRRDHTTDVDSVILPLNCSTSNFTLSSSNPSSTNSLGMLVSAMETIN